MGKDESEDRYNRKLSGSANGKNKPNTPDVEIIPGDLWARVDTTLFNLGRGKTIVWNRRRDQLILMLDENDKLLFDNDTERIFNMLIQTLADNGLMSFQLDTEKSDMKKGGD